MLCFCPMLPTPQGSGCGHCRSARQQLPHTLLFQRWPQFPRVPLPLSLRTAHSGAVLGRSLKAGQSPSALRFLAGLSLPVTGNSSTYKVTAGALRCWAQEGLRDDGEFRLPLVLAQGSPIFHSSFEGELGFALESLQGPLGSPVPGILQARTLEWVAISFSNA